MTKKIGKQTVELKSNPRIIGTASIVGPKEGKGPLKDYFDVILNDDTNGEETFEKAECSITFDTITALLQKTNLKKEDVDYIFSGDLLNQLYASNFAMRDLQIPYVGVYGACSTMALSLCMASMIIDGGFGNYAIAATSSHFASAERQFRTPLEYGGQRSVTSQWTVTGSGAAMVSTEGDFPRVTHVTIGKVKDYEITDANNMGAAMAPAAVDTIRQHLEDTGRQANYYDVIATGDLGSLGKEITEKLLIEYGYNVSNNYIDCGVEIFKSQEASECTMCGGSGCGCSATVFCGYLYKSLVNKKIKKVLLVSTGALMSPTSSLQGESIPGIAHAVAIEY